MLLFLKIEIVFLYLKCIYRTFPEKIKYKGVNSTKSKVKDISKSHLKINPFVPNFSNPKNITKPSENRTVF